MKTFGWLLLIVGGLMVLVALAMDTTVASSSGMGRVHNIGLLSRQSSTLTAGALMVLVGVLVLLLGRRQSKADGSGMRACPYCAEQIQAAAVVCRFCNREVQSAVPRTQEQEMQALGITYADGNYWYKGQRHYMLSAAMKAAREDPARIDSKG